MGYLIEALIAFCLSTRMYHVRKLETLDSDFVSMPNGCCSCNHNVASTYLKMRVTQVCLL